LPVVGFGEDHLDRTDRPWESTITSPRGMHRRRVTSTPARALTRHTLSTNSPVSHRHARIGSSGERCGGRVARSPIVASIQPPCTRRRPWPLDVARTPTRMALVTASPKPGRARRQPRRDGGRQLLQAGSHGTARRTRQGRKVSEPATGTYSYRPLPALRPSWPGGGSCRPR